MEIQETDLGSEDQIEKYNQLFQSVLCGIVCFDTIDNGNIVFEEANREAIRILGYTPEEFWDKKEWDLSAIIVRDACDPILPEIYRPEKPGVKKSFECRITQKSGKTCWVVGSCETVLRPDGSSVTQSVFLDINDRKETQTEIKRLSEKVEAGNEILRLALEQTSIYEFYCYPRSGIAVIPDRTSKHYHCSRYYADIPKALVEDLIRIEYQNDFYDMYNKIQQGEKTATIQIPLKHENIWCRLTMSTVAYSDDGNPSYVVAIMEDITKEKEMETALIDVRSRDELTGLYKKEAGIALVREYMEKKKPEEPCTLMLLDMDNLKQINIEEGRVFADAILQDVADILVSSTKREDIQIRLGGDEFMVFVKNCDKPDAMKLGPKIAARVKGLCGGDQASIPVSASIGMCATSVVNEYAGLYRCAESSLLYVKANGKGQAVCYLDISTEIGIALTEIYTNSHTYNEIDSKEQCQDKNMIDFALDLLGKSKKISDAIFLLLARMGTRYGLDRVSILEIDSEYLCYRYSYQWVKHKQDSLTDQNCYISLETYKQIAASYDNDGICERAVYDNDRMKSCLHAAIWDGGAYAGALIFEKKEEEYCWNQEQKNLVKEMAKLFASFIMKVRVDAASKAKTDFLSRMSHEIRTPMNAISGMTAIAKTLLDDKEKALECLNKIEASNEYLLLLINDILDMSKIESGKMELHYEDVDLGEYLVGLTEMMTPQAAKKGISLEVRNQYSENRCLLLDSLRLNQVLINIIGNAIKFTGENGKVVLTVEPFEKEPDRVKLLFSVKDTGIGISKENIGRIFNAFEQGDRKIASNYGGTGLGLSISSRLVQMMGGNLKVMSQVGKGSDFYFTIPFLYGRDTVKKEKQDKKSRDKTKESPYCFQGVRLLLAEDDPINQEIEKTILEMNGFITEEAFNGKEALELFISHEPGYYKAILMDIRMPIMDGLEATRKIRRSEKEDARTIPIIAMTANAFGEDTKKSIASGMNGHLSKPIVVKQLLETLNSCLNAKKS